MKLEGYLKLSGLPYQTKDQNDPRKGPKKKLPYVKIEKQVMGDSEHVYEYLHANHLIDLDAHLDDLTKSIHHGLRVMCDEGLYFVLLYSRWMDEENWDTVRESMFASIPKILRPVITKQIRKKIQGDLIAQGTGLHNSGEIYAVGEQHINALGHYLGDNQWFGGDTPAKLDVVAVSYLANIAKPPIRSPLQVTLKKWPNLMAFTDRALQHIYLST